MLLVPCASCLHGYFAGRMQRCGPGFVALSSVEQRIIPDISPHINTKHHAAA
jgi:hypothetical protein